MEIERRKLKRKPLSDCTNIPATKSLHTSSKFSLLTKPSFPTQNSDENSSKYDTSTGSNVQNPRIRPQTSTPPLPCSSATSVENSENAGVATLNTGRLTRAKTRDTRKDVSETVPLSCPPAGRIRSLGDKFVKEHRDVALSKAGDAHNSRIHPQSSSSLRSNSSANSVECSENAGVATVYSRRPPRDKGKEVAETIPFSCAPTGRIRSIGDKLVKRVALPMANNAQNPIIRPQPSTPRRLNFLDISVASAVNDGFATLNSKRLTRDKGKEAAETIPFTCPPAGKIRSTWDKPVKEHRDVTLSNSCTDVHPPNKQKRQSSSTKSPALTQEYIEKQNAYFAEIDAFELPEEVVSESELE